MVITPPSTPDSITTSTTDNSLLSYYCEEQEGENIYHRSKCTILFDIFHHFANACISNRSC
jgi:hypothetical protein